MSHAGMPPPPPPETPPPPPGSPPPPSEATLDAYLDGLLTPAQARAFEVRLAQEPALRAELDRQGAVDALLCRRFIPPPPGRVVTALRQRIQGPAKAPARVPARPPAIAGRLPAGRRWLVAALAAAAVVVLALGASAWLTGTWPFRGPASYDEIYQAKVAGGLKPAWVCQTNAQLALYLRARLGEGLTLAALPTGIESLGVGYPTPREAQRGTTILLARVDGQPVLVFIDRADGDPRRPHAPSCHLQVFERRVGSLLLREVTPFTQPRMLDLFLTPPATPAGRS